jgi:hypothetical protein
MTVVNTLLAVLTGGGLAVVGTVLTGLLTNWLNGRHAREVRRQDRLDQAYIELGQHLSHHEDWAKSVQPYWGSPAAPDPLTPQERWRIETVVLAYGSEKVRDLLDQWFKQARKIKEADDLISSVEKSHGPSAEIVQQADQEKLSLLDYKAAMQQADLAIRDQMRRELAGKSSRRIWGRNPR